MKENGVFFVTEAEKRMHRCCFTGHRPEKLHMPEQEVLIKLEKSILQAISEGINVFITGMAPGVDIWAAEIVIRLRDEERYPLKLIAAVPHPDFDQRWSLSWQKRYAAVMAAADLRREISPKYHRGVYQVRNEWMVDHSARVIAVWNGQPSGTKNTIMYANQNKVPVINIIEEKA